MACCLAALWPLLQTTTLNRLINFHEIFSCFFLFFLKHSCDRETTFCLMTEPEPADSASQSQSTAAVIPRAKYTCVCKEGLYIPNETFQGFSSDKVEMEAGNFSCLVCPNSCPMCDKDGSCIYGHEEPEEFLTESVLRASIGAILGACVGCCLVLSFIVFRQRKCKVSLNQRQFTTQILLFLFSFLIHDIDDCCGHVDHFRDYFAWHSFSLLSGKY